MNDDKIKQLEDFSKLIDLFTNRLTKKDFSEAFSKVADTVAEIRKELSDTAAKLSEAVDEARNNLEGRTTEHTSTLQSALNELSTRLLAAEQRIEQRLAEIKDGENGKDADPEEVARLAAALIKLPEYRAPIMDGPEEIASKLELLEEGKELDPKVVRGLNDLIKEVEELKKRPAQIITTGAGNERGGRIVKVHDLSDSLDGSTKTFALPAFWRVISVHLSSTPNILRPTIEYTTDASAMTITFTSQIDETTSLLAGQSCIVVYSEA